MGAKFRGGKLTLVIDDPDEAADFLRGLIVARSNNSSEYFVELIDGVNAILDPWRKAVREGGVDAVFNT